jgi:hypothetical protein
MNEGKVPQKRCSLAEQAPLHEPTGLRVMPLSAEDHGAIRTRVRHEVELPDDCCPVSHNPRPGSTFRLRYRPMTATLEVYTLRRLLQRFVGSWPGNKNYPAERNMEGMIQLVVQMVADALGTPVRARADLVLDTGKMEVVCEARPCAPPED